MRLRVEPSVVRTAMAAKDIESSENLSARAKIRADLLRQARALPRQPGVYFLKDKDGEVIYVGKASVLPDRVSSYFVPAADHGARKQPMLALIESFETTICQGSWEALLLESRCIKDMQPRYNSMGLDDRTYPYLAITIREPFPGVYITREPASERFRSARILGPFTSTGDLRLAVQLLQRVFQFRTCDLKIDPTDPQAAGFRPCVLHSIHQCSAPCALRISPERYGEDIERFTRFITSRRTEMLVELRVSMAAASERQDFERAAVLRDQVRSIERLDDREKRARATSIDWQPEVTAPVLDGAQTSRSLQRVLESPAAVRCIEGIDIAHLGGNEVVGSKVCFIDGRPFRAGYRRFRVRTAGNDDFAAMREVVSRRYRDAGAGKEMYPDLILIDGGPGQLNAALEALGQLEHQPPFVAALAKREELLWLPGRKEGLRLSRNHGALRICQAVRDEAHRFAQQYHHLLRSKSLLGKDATKPRRATKPGSKA